MCILSPGDCRAFVRCSALGRDVERGQIIIVEVRLRRAQLDTLQNPPSSGEPDHC